jgi:transcription elongation GreA/GreB family factor
MDELQIKKELRELVLAELQAKLAALKKAMEDAQQNANQHVGAMASRYDSFKEEAQALRDGFALQIQRTAETLAQIEQIMVKMHTTVSLGSVVITEAGNFFISTGLIGEALQVSGVKYECISIGAPAAQKLRGKRAGDSVEAGGLIVKIRSIF